MGLAGTRRLRHLVTGPHQGRGQQLMDEMVDFTEQATAETEDGSLSWLVSALGFPEYPAEVHAYGNVIGTGNAVV